MLPTHQLAPSPSFPRFLDPPHSHQPGQDSDNDLDLVRVDYERSPRPRRPALNRPGADQAPIALLRGRCTSVQGEAPRMPLGIHGPPIGDRVEDEVHLAGHGGFGVNGDGRVRGGRRGRSRRPLGGPNGGGVERDDAIAPPRRELDVGHSGRAHGRDGESRGPEVLLRQAEVWHGRDRLGDFLGLFLERFECRLVV